MGLFEDRRAADALDEQSKIGIDEAYAELATYTHAVLENVVAEGAISVSVASGSTFYFPQPTVSFTSGQIATTTYVEFERA